MKNLVAKMLRHRWMPLILLPLLCSLIYAAPEASSKSASDEVFRQLLYLPAPTPHNTALDEEEENQKKRPPDFYDADHAPPDNAPAGDLLDYWERWAGTSNREGLKPSDVVRERLLAACEDAPERLPHLLAFMSDTTEAADRIKKLYDAAQGDERFDDTWRKGVREWLLMNSNYFLSDLLALAQKAKDKDGHMDKDNALKSLAKVDWESAAPLLQSLSGGSQPRLAALALTLLYKHALEAKDSSDEEKYRARLQAIAVDRNAPANARDTVIEALSLTDWAGRDEWYLSLFADETLREPTDGSYLFNPLTTLFERDPDKWIPVMAKLVESKDPAVRQNAASCLVNYTNEYPRRDAILPILRWLSDPDWLDLNGTYRAWFMQQMDEVEIPESVPGLIWIVENEKSNRMWAARTLAHYKDPRAVPALKKALADEKDENYRNYLIEGLLASGGITESEQLSALEAYALKLTTEEGRKELERYSYDDANPLPLAVSIGKYLARDKEPPEALVRAALARVESLKKNPEQARALLGVIQGWQSRLVDLDMLHRIGAGSADAAMIANALERREKLRATVAGELQSLVGAGGAAQGVAAVLLEDALLAQNILGTGDEPTQIALLACARLVQMPLPVAQVGALLRGKSANLSLAAERYLLAEDSPEARQLLWEHHPQQAFITGWRENIQLIGGNNFSAMDKAEDKLRAELFKPEDAPVEIFALLGNGEQAFHVLRIYAKRAVYTHYEEARYSERVITGEELNRFKTFVTSNNILELGPQFGFCHHDCWVSEFLMLKRQGGRRVFSHQGMGAWITLLANFDLMGGDGAKIHYRFEDEIKGLEVLFADDALPVKDVWQRGDDLRVLVEREATLEDYKQEAEENAGSEDEDEDEPAARVARRRRQVERTRARFSWHPLKDGKPGEATSQPEGYSTFDENLLEIDDDAFPSNLNSHLAQAVSGDFVVLARDIGEGGLWKKAAGQQAVRISSGEGVYANPIVTPDGQWVVVAKAESNWGTTNDVVRFDLKTGREHRVNLPSSKDFEPVMYVAAQGRVLLHRAREGGDEKNSDGLSSSEFYLLDAATGRTQPVTGVFEPLQEVGRGFLQPTGRPNEVWAAIPDQAKNQTRVGRYNLKDFSFEVLLVVPHLTFDSAAIWADEGGTKFYLIYQGQLLRLPLPNSSPAKSNKTP